MAHENPLLTLGVPKLVLTRELAAGTPEEVVKLASKLYRVLSQRYHPDMPSGDADLMGTLSSAFEQLSDPDGLEFFIEELIGSADLEGLYRQQQASRLVSRDTAALQRLAAGMVFTDQFRALELDGPTSFLVSVAGNRLVVEVVSSTSATAKMVTVEDDAPISMVVEYIDGTWHEENGESTDLNDDEEADIQSPNFVIKMVPYDAFASSEPIQVVGFVSSSWMDGPDSTDRDQSYDTTAIGGGQFRLNWEDPADCWFLEHLTYGTPPRNSCLVLHRGGKFALTGSILGTAPLT